MLTENYSSVNEEVFRCNSCNARIKSFTLHKVVNEAEVEGASARITSLEDGEPLFFTSDCCRRIIPCKPNPQSLDKYLTERRPKWPTVLPHIRLNRFKHLKGFDELLDFCEFLSEYRKKFYSVSMPSEHFRRLRKSAGSLIESAFHGQLDDVEAFTELLCFMAQVRIQESGRSKGVEILSNTRGCLLPSSYMAWMSKLAFGYELPHAGALYLELLQNRILLAPWERGMYKNDSFLQIPIETVRPDVAGPLFFNILKYQKNQAR